MKAPLDESRARRAALAAVLVAFFTILTTAPAVADVELARDGMTAYRIVISRAADVSTHSVAEDFAALLKEISDATFPIITDDSAPTDHEIIVGHDNRRPAAIDTSGMAIGAYEIRTAGTKLLIAGAPPRGMINGLYGFLQDHLGCRFSRRVRRACRVFRRSLSVTSWIDSRPRFAGVQ